MILGAIGQVGVDGGVGYVVEYAGDAIRALSMEERMTVCNMSIEWGARAGIIAPDDTTFAYLEGREHAPQGAACERAIEDWRSLASDPGASTTRTSSSTSTELVPQVTWGTNPGMVVPVTGTVPDPASFDDPDDRIAAERALAYMDLRAGQRSRTSGRPRLHRLLHERAHRGSPRRGGDRPGTEVDQRVTALVVPGSATVRRQAEEEGLDRVFLDAGFEWRLAGCSMCLGMNPDILAPGERCASTSNRNFEGRQGRGGRTHLVSPQMAAAAALHGSFVDVRTLDREPVTA